MTEPASRARDTSRKGAIDQATTRGAANEFAAWRAIVREINRELELESPIGPPCPTEKPPSSRR